jgi:hypothetical protein
MAPSWMKGFGLILLLATVGVVSCQGLFSDTRPMVGSSSPATSNSLPEQR